MEGELRARVASLALVLTYSAFDKETVSSYGLSLTAWMGAFSLVSAKLALLP